MHPKVGAVAVPLSARTHWVRTSHLGLERLQTLPRTLCVWGKGCIPALSENKARIEREVREIGMDSEKVDTRSLRSGKIRMRFRLYPEQHENIRFALDT